MITDQETAALEAAANAAESAGTTLSSAEARRIIRAYLRAMGREEDAWGNFKIDAKTRWNFGDTVLRKQAKGPNGWHNLSSKSLIVAATNLLHEAGEKLGKTQAIERAAKIRSKRVKAKEHAVSKKHKESGRSLAMKDLASRERDAVLRNATGDTLPEEQYQQLRKQLEERGGFFSQFIFAAKRDVPDDSTFASIEAPPFLPVFYAISYVWNEKVDGVEYTVEFEHADRDTARVQIGTSNSYVRVDPVTGRIRPENPDAVGDGALYGSVTYSRRDKAFGARMFLLIAKERQKGAGARLLKAWCQMLRGYGVKAWVAIGVGDEGAAFLAAMHKRGVIRILRTDGSNVVISCT